MFYNQGRTRKRKTFWLFGAMRDSPSRLTGFPNEQKGVPHFLFRERTESIHISASQLDSRWSDPDQSRRVGYIRGVLSREGGLAPCVGAAPPFTDHKVVVIHANVIHSLHQKKNHCKTYTLVLHAEEMGQAKIMYGQFPHHVCFVSTTAK